QFGINEVGPCQNLIRGLFLFDERLAFRYAFVVTDGFAHREPSEEGHEEKHSNDRYIVGFRDDETEIGVDYAQGQEAEHARKDNGGYSVVIKLVRPLQRDQQKDRRGRDQEVWSRKRVDEFFDKQ